jgi:hypothetical protein
LATMKKLAVTLPGLMILAIIVIIIGIYASDTWRVTPDATDTALKQVFNDAEFQQVLSQEDRSYRVISEDTIGPSSNKGFINYSGRLTGVLIDVENPLKIAPYHFHFIVDVERKRTLDKTSWLDLPSDQTVTIPPGAAWYDRVQAFDHMMNTVRLWEGYTPENASIYMLIVKQEGLDILRNASGQVPLQDIDVSGYSYAYNSTIPDKKGQTLMVGLPPTDKSAEIKSLAGSNIAGSPDSAYFVVVINGGNTDINATISGLPLLYY